MILPLYCPLESWLDKTIEGFGVQKSVASEMETLVSAAQSRGFSKQRLNKKEFRLLIYGTRRLVQTLIGIFVNEGSITKQTFYLRITENGKHLPGRP